MLASGFVSLRNQAYSRYVNFFQQLFGSSSREVRHLVRIVARDVRSVTSRNVNLVTSSSGLSPWNFAKWRVKEKLTIRTVPENQEWRTFLLLKMLDMRQDLHNQNMNTKPIQGMIDSLCSTWSEDPLHTRWLEHLHYLKRLFLLSMSGIIFNFSMWTNILSSKYTA